MKGQGSLMIIVSNISATVKPLYNATICSAGVWGGGGGGVQWGYYYNHSFLAYWERTPSTIVMIWLMELSAFW